MEVSSQADRMEYPWGFLFYKPFLAQQPVTGICDLSRNAETPQRRLVAIFGTKWGCKLEFGSRSIRSPKVNFLALTIKKWQAGENFPKMTRKWPNLGFRPITLEPSGLGRFYLATCDPLGSLYQAQGQSQKFWFLVIVLYVVAISMAVLIISNSLSIQNKNWNVGLHFN